MNTMHLFAGGGGGLLCDLILGHTPIVAVEWDKNACRVLRDRAADGWFPGLHVYEGDVRMFDPSDYAGRVDSIAAGFPCQDISQAGNQAGLSEGTRSGLYREVLRIADIVRPQYLFLENVAAILANEHLGTVLGDMATRGYDARWCCLEASGVGAPHKRDRWWMLASLADAGCRRFGEPSSREMEQSGRAETIGTGLDTDADRKRQLQPQGIDQDERGWSGDFCEDVADAADERLHERRRFGDARENMLIFGRDEWNGISSSKEEKSQILADANPARREEQHPTAEPDGQGPLASRTNAGRMDGSTKSDLGRVVDGMAFGSHKLDWWSTEPDIGRVATGIQNRSARLKMLGNGQVPLQAAAAWAILGGPL